jgi:hypothetical protein
MRKKHFLGARRGLLFGLIAAMALGWGTGWAAVAEKDQAIGRIMAQQMVKDKPLWITSDHTQHEILKQPFAAGPEVTQACLTCHNQAALQFHKTIHWTWMDPSTADSTRLGKGGLSINNF